MLKTTKKIKIHKIYELKVVFFIQKYFVQEILYFQLLDDELIKSNFIILLPMSFAKLKYKL